MTFSLATASLVVAANLLGQATASGQTVIVRGTDYLRTASGTTFDFGFGPVEFEGKPIGPGLADTIVQRKRDAVPGRAIPIEMTTLSLVSKSPVNIPGKGPCNFKIELNHSHRSTGVMTIAANPDTFTSTMEVYFTASAATAAGAACIPPQSDHVTLTGLDTEWQAKAPPGAELVPGRVGDGRANLHTNLRRRQVDFFIVNVVGNPDPLPQTQERQRVREAHPKGRHVAGTAPVPPSAQERGPAGPR